MDQIISNPGLDPISETFVQYLDYQSLKTLEFVSQDFNSFYNGNKTIWLNQLKNTQKNFEDETLNQISVQLKNSEIQRIQKFVELVHVCVELSRNSRLELHDLCDFCETQDDFESLDFLLELLQNINYDDAFFIACEYGRIDFVRSMNFPSIDVNKTSEDGMTPLMVACANGNIKTVEFLLGLPGINFNARNMFGRTALDIAKQNRHIAIVNLVVSECLNAGIKLKFFDCIPEKNIDSFIFDVLKET